jgi:hypothetical protein
MEHIAMNATALLPALAMAMASALVLAPAQVQAANADNPYGNVDHSNDRGNDTGDSKVEGLNKGQLNQNYSGPSEMRAPSQGSGVVLQPGAPQPAPR